VAAVAAGVAGAAVAAVLSDKDNRKKVAHTMEMLKGHAVNAMDQLDRTANSMDSKSKLGETVQKLNTTIQSGKETLAQVKSVSQPNKKNT